MEFTDLRKGKDWVSDLLFQPRWSIVLRILALLWVLSWFMIDVSLSILDRV